MAEVLSLSGYFPQKEAKLFCYCRTGISHVYNTSSLLGQLEIRLIIWIILLSSYRKKQQQQQSDNRNKCRSAPLTQS